jgi:putative transposase
VKARLGEGQIIQILREGEQDGQTISELCRKHGISEQTFYRWRRKYGGMGEPDVRRLRELERENGRLKKLVAERDLEIDVLREVLGKGS